MFEFLNNLLEFLSTSLEFFVDFAIYILKFALWFFAYLVSLISSIFPNSPFDVSGFVVGIEKYVGYLNWIVPLNNIMTITLLWGSCMLLYYGYGVVMRYLKIID